MYRLVEHPIINRNIVKTKYSNIALENAMCYYEDYNENHFAVIKVEGYPCIAHLVSTNVNNTKIHSTIFPFDDKRTYPMQEVQQDYSFVYNYTL